VDAPAEGRRRKIFGARMQKAGGADSNAISQMAFHLTIGESVKKNSQKVGMSF